MNAVRRRRGGAVGEPDDAVVQLQPRQLERQHHDFTTLQLAAYLARGRTADGVALQDDGYHQREGVHADLRRGRAFGQGRAESPAVLRRQQLQAGGQRRGDQRVPAKLGDGQRGMLRKRMPAPAEQVSLVLPQQFHDQSLVLAREPDVGYRQLDLGRQDASGQRGPVGDREVHHDLGMALHESTERGADREVRRVRSGPDPQQPDLESEHLLQVLLDGARLA